MINITCNVKMAPYIDEAIDEINTRLATDSQLGYRAKIAAALPENPNKEQHTKFESILIHNLRHHNSIDDKAMENFPQPEWFDCKLTLEIMDKRTGLPDGETNARSA